MSQQQPEGIPRLGAGTIPSLGAGSIADIPRIGGGVSLDAPQLPPRNLTRPTTFDPSQTGSLSLMDQALGRASLILDQVRARRLSWQDAHDVLKTLSDDDKKTIARFRPDMGEDEKRALDLPKGGGLLGRIAGYSGLDLLKDLGINADKGLLEMAGVNTRGDPVGRVGGNLVTDVGETVRTLPAGLYKTATTVGSDVGEIAHDPAKGITFPHTREEILGPIAEQYGYTYGPALHGDFGKTGARIMDHPLGPILDAFAVASAGIGTVARVGAASRAIAATRVVEEAPGVLRMGVTNRTAAQYEPLGYSKEFYVKPSTKQLKEEPYAGHFSVLIDAKTGDSLFSPMGSSHDEIYQPLFEGAGTAKRDRWDNPEKHPIIQATGIFDPKTGKPVININPEDVPSAYIDNVPNIIGKVKAEAESTYLSRSELKATQRENTAGTLVIRQGKATNRYDPVTGAKQEALWYIMRPNGQRLASNLPTKEAAIAHAQSLVTGGIKADTLEQSWRPFVEPPSFAEPLGREGRERIAGEGLRSRGAVSIGREAFMQRPRGGLIDAYERARGTSHAAEIENIVSEVVNNVLDNPELRLKRRGVREALTQLFQEMGEDFATSGSKDIGRFRARTITQGEFIPPATSAALSAAGITLREVSDLVRAGAVFLRPAYIPNNWAGNAFLNVIQQGVYAPINLAKALYIDKSIGTRYARGIDQSMGFNASNVLSGGRGSGYVASATDPVAKLMGSIADQPFRRAAWIHEARRAGYKTMQDIQKLWDKAYTERQRFTHRDPDQWDMESTPALAAIGKISRAAQEEIVKFGKYNDVERGILRNLVFVYSWMRGAGRYFGRFPMQHPIQAAAMTSLSAVGQNWLNQTLGGVPAFLVGAIPVGKDEKGNHILINPFSINPLSTGQEILSSAASVKNIITDPRNFNKYVNQDPSALLNPLVQDALEAWSGGRPITESVPDSIAALRLKENLEHPGRGQIYPTSQQEALGQYFLGSMFPRKTSAAGIARSLQRERADQPAERIDDELAAFKKQTGADLPPEFVEMYRKDLAALDKQKDFQHQYAKDHGSQGFSNMPANNRAEAALEYLSKNKLIAPRDVAQMADMVRSAKSDYELNLIANALWRITGAGNIKEQWDQLIHGSTAQTSLTPLRP